MTNQQTERKEKISILGCGWYGFALAKKLIENGYSVKGSTTSEEKIAILKTENIQPYLVNFEADKTEYDVDFFDCDVLFICIPPKKNSPQLLDFPVKIEKIAEAAQKAKVKQVVFISSTKVYQDGNFVVNENTIPQPTTDSGKAILAAENILKQNQTFTATIIRFAGLIGPERNLAKHFAGKKDIANGLAPINLIHLADCIGITEVIIKQKAFGKIYHGVTPNHPTRKDFYTKACIASSLEEPSFIAELLSWKQIESKNVPEVLAYEYVFKNWDKYFETLS
ncbi:NAD(P)H-binding protein [Pedobacter sp. LMG 31464]|uniref:NAD(P)H-binding protein n=1 Tax=Pedobacter planticolens TaxID=2679964 RepID=A0A923IW30_9SPHI|nr:NAD(P)H-binding protein [Pedobacter planticolens]MBB2146488.1 NAD(P)H-binding protein [Pedobacter planticolens]